MCVRNVFSSTNVHLQHFCKVCITQKVTVIFVKKSSMSKNSTKISNRLDAGKKKIQKTLRFN